MSVPERPDESVEWAESPHAEVEEPEELRLYGWPYGFVPPSAAFNWLQRSVGRWIGWLEAKVDGHVHDGGSSPGSVAKVDPKEHVDWGDHGHLEGEDGLNQHTITHGGTVDRENRRFLLGQVIPTRVILETTDQAHRVHMLPFSSEGLDALFIHGKSETDPVLLSLFGKFFAVSGAEFGSDVDVYGRVDAQNTPTMVAVFDGDGERVNGSGSGVSFTKEGNLYRTNLLFSSARKFVIHITGVVIGGEPLRTEFYPDTTSGLFFLEFKGSGGTVTPSYFYVTFYRLED